MNQKKSHNVIQLNPDEDKYYLLTQYLTLMQQLKKFPAESIRAIARNPNIHLQPIGIYSKSDIQHHIHTQQFQELLPKKDTIQRQFIDQNLRKLAKTAGFSDIYAQDYCEFFKDLKNYIYLNGEKKTDRRYITNKCFLFCKFQKRASCLSRMTLLHLRKIDSIIRNVKFSWVFFLSPKRNLQYKRHTHTSRQTSKRSTHTFCSIFLNIFYIKK